MASREKRRRSARLWLAAAAMFLLVLGAGVFRFAAQRTVQTPTPAAVATITIPLATIRGEARVPQVRLPAGSGTIRVLVPTPDTAAPPFRLVIDGPAGFHLEKPGEAGGRNAAFLLDAPLPAGRCDIKVYSGATLAAAGQVDLAR
jgi:hypothetical protein